jgi:membrane protein
VSPTQRLGYRLQEFLRRLWDKAVADDIFFMAGAVAFNVVGATIPLLLLGVGISGHLLSARVADPVGAAVTLVVDALPQGAVGADPSAFVRTIVSGVLDQRSGFTLFGALFFIWLATRLAGTLRIALREIFDIGQDRGIIRGKLFDIQVVAVGVLLLTLNLGVTVAIEAALDLGVGFGLTRRAVGWVDRSIGFGVALASIWTLFLVVYRYLPARRIPWRTSLVAASFSAVAHETLKYGFSWYATEVANYTSTWGNLATVAVLFFWIYYEAVVFILGGEVAQVYTMRKARNVQVRTQLAGDA